MKKENREKLLNIAKETVEKYVKTGEVLDFQISEKELNKKQGAFVTLHIGGQLRGCIGQIMPSESPLWELVRDMAIEASCHDPRFTPVSKDELKKLNYEISVLSAPKKIEDWKEVKLGKHGVIISKNNKGGVFLPQVAEETGWDLEEFLSNLCSQKAGLAFDAYRNDSEVKIEIFEAEVFNDKTLLTK